MPPTDPPAAVDAAALRERVENANRCQCPSVHALSDVPMTAGELRAILDALDAAREEALRMDAQHRQARTAWSRPRWEVPMPPTDQPAASQDAGGVEPFCCAMASGATTAWAVQWLHESVHDYQERLSAARGEALRMDEAHRQARTAWMAALEEVRGEKMRKTLSRALDLECLCRMRQDGSCNTVWHNEARAALAATDTAARETD